MLDKAVTNGPAVHPEVREDAKNVLYRTRHLRVFLVFQRVDGPHLRPDGPSLVPDGALFSFERSVV
jgi:hypothetical protein